MIPITPNTLLNPLVSGPLSRQARALRMTVGPRAIQSNKKKQNKQKQKRSNQLTWTRKVWDASQQKFSCMLLKVAESLTNSWHVPMRICGYTHGMYYVIILIIIIIITHAINFNAHRHKIMFQHKLAVYRLHYKNAYSDQKEPKRRESGREMRRETGRTGK